MMRYLRTMVFGAMFASASAIAVASRDDVIAAQNTVEEYKALRKTCAITQGDERKECFSQLRATIDDYKQAKRLLATSGPVN